MSACICDPFLVAIFLNKLGSLVVQYIANTLKCNNFYLLVSLDIRFRDMHCPSSL